MGFPMDFPRFPRRLAGRWRRRRGGSGRLRLRGLPSGLRRAWHSHGLVVMNWGYHHLVDLWQVIMMEINLENDNDDDIIEWLMTDS